MAVSLNPRAERLLARLPRVTVYSGLELLLLLLIAVQCARLFWGMMVPIGPVGDFKALDQMRAAPPMAPSVGTFDPFFRAGQVQQGAATETVTALDIRLYGISGNNATGGGSAIVGAAQGEQRMVRVGEEVMPGVVLVAIGFDHVTISRNGQNEKLYIDQTPTGQSGQGMGVPGQSGMQPQPQYQPVPTVVAPVPPPPPVVMAPNPAPNPGQSQ